MYLMTWKFVIDLWFHEVLQTTIVKQITKGNISFHYLPDVIVISLPWH